MGESPSANNRPDESLGAGPMKAAWQLGHYTTRADDRLELTLQSS